MLDAADLTKAKLIAADPRAGVAGELGPKRGRPDWSSPVRGARAGRPDGPGDGSRKRPPVRGLYRCRHGSGGPLVGVPQRSHLRPGDPDPGQPLHARWRTAVLSPGPTSRPAAYQDADLRSANLTGAVLVGCDLRGADLTSTELEGVQGRDSMLEQKPDSIAHRWRTSNSHAGSAGRETAAGHRASGG